MSGEFGDYSYGGYFHRKVESAHEDLSGEPDPLCQAYAGVFELLAVAARSISWWKAGDSGVDDAQTTTAMIVQPLAGAVSRLEREVEAIVRAEVRAYLDAADFPDPEWADEQKKRCTVRMKDRPYVDGPTLAQSHQYQVRRKALQAHVSRWAGKQGARGWSGDQSWVERSSMGGGSIPAGVTVHTFEPASYGEAAHALLGQMAEVVQTETDPARRAEKLTALVASYQGPRS